MKGDTPGVELTWKDMKLHNLAIRSVAIIHGWRRAYAILTSQLGLGYAAVFCSGLVGLDDAVLVAKESNIEDAKAACVADFQKRLANPFEKFDCEKVEIWR